MNAAGAKPRRSIVLVTGLSGAGKLSILRSLEDLGFEAVDNPPLTLIEELVSRSGRPLAVGVDARSSGFDAREVLTTLARLRLDPALRPELVFAWADEAALLRRYTETRRRHPLAASGGVAHGIAAEAAITAPLRESADLLLDTSDLPLPELRRLIEQRFGHGGDGDARLTVSLVSFAYPRGLPREAELVFDARFLRNPHYDPILRNSTGVAQDVGAYIEADPDFPRFFSKLTDLLTLLLPRFREEGKKYVTIAVGCTGGRHRSVYLVERLAEMLRNADHVAGGECGRQRSWHVTVTHRELLREGAMQTREAAGRAPTGRAARRLPAE